jgi:hypothetical protein
MANLRETIEAGLATSLESPGGFGLPVLLVDPDGEEHGPYYGQILYNTKRIDPMTGVEIVVKDPIVTLRRSSLARVPEDSEKNRWAVRIPVTPSVTADKVTYGLGRPIEDGASIGFIRLYLTKLVQA